MQCEYCGNYVESGDRKCPSCGARLICRKEPPEEAPLENTPPEDTSDSWRDTDYVSYGELLDIKHYLVPSIICTILFISPFGLVATIYGILVKIRVNSEDGKGAMKASKRARLWMWIGYIVGVIVYYLIGKNR